MGYTAIIAAAAAVDQAAKYFAPRLGMAVSQNTGTAFGLFRGFPCAVSVLACAMLGCMLYAIFRLSSISPPVRAWLAVAAGGAASNILDRFARGGVLDWMRLPFSEPFFSGGLRFNLADVFIGLGLLAAALLLFLKERESYR